MSSILFIVYFCLFLGTFFLGFYFLRGYLDFLNVITANITGFILDVFLNITYQGKYIFLENLNIEIIFECTGIYAMFIYCSCVLAFPTFVKKKLWGILFGLPLIYLINIIRMVFLGFIGMYYPGSFDFFHSYFWQTTFIVIVIFIWLIWISLFVKKKHTKT